MSVCVVCGSSDFGDPHDGLFFCLECGTQSQVRAPSPHEPTPVFSKTKMPFLSRRTCVWRFHSWRRDEADTPGLSGQRKENLVSIPGEKLVLFSV